jgi:hypothetical protein
MPIRAFAVVALLVTAACSPSGSSTPVTPMVTTVIFLGPAVATDTYRPSGLPAAWTGFCPVATPSTVTITAGNSWQIANRTDRAVEVDFLSNRSPVESIAAGGNGIVHVEYGAVSQSTFTFSLTAGGCTDTASGQGLVNVTVNSR